MPTPPHPSFISLNRFDGLAIACIVLAVAAVFGQTVGFGLLDWDDYGIARAPMVVRGLSLEGVEWALTTRHSGLWHPLTWISLMLDATLWGKWAGGLHLTNTLIHALAAVSLYLWLATMTGERGRSLLVALLFAIHPLRAESVAWASERKDVLCALLSILCLWAASRWIVGRSPRAALATWVFFVLAIMAKPMAVTLPLVMPLLALWPARGGKPLSPATLARMLLPLFAVSAAVGWEIAQPSPDMGFQQSPDSALPLDVRARLAVASVQVYLWQAVWPVDLAFIYPIEPGRLNIDAAAGVAAIIVLLALAVRCRARRPWVTAGVLWYLVMLVPVSGIVQIGVFAHADRYSYLPLVGIFTAVVWSLPVARWAPAARIAASAGVVLAFGALAFWQTGHWRNLTALTTRAIEIYPEHLAARIYRAREHQREGKSREALDDALVAARVAGTERATAANAYIIAGDASSRLGARDAAVAYWRKALAEQPTYAEALLRVGYAELREGNLSAALEKLATVARERPDSVEVWNYLAEARERAGDSAGAQAAHAEVLRLTPGSVAGLVRFGNFLERSGRPAEALRVYRDALRLEPAHRGAQEGLARTQAAA